MATKYCDVSLGTGLNDGTSTANAWQSLVDVLDGTPTSGSYTTGDVIIIRTADGGGNLTEAATANLTTPTKTGAEENPVIWRFDDGIAWAQAGTFELTFNTGATSWTVQGGNIFDGGRAFETRRFKTILNSSTGDFDIVTEDSIQFIGWELARGATPSSSQETRIRPDISSLKSTAYFINCKFTNTTPTSGTNYPAQEGLIEVTTLSKSLTFVGCEFSLESNLALDCVFATGTTDVLWIELIGCKITNTISTHTLIHTVPNSATRSTRIHMKDCDLDNIDEQQVVYTDGGTNNDPGEFEIISEMEPGGDFFKRTARELVRYKSTGNYPTLNATIPDSGTAWSMLVWPDTNNCNLTSPATVGAMTKWYNGTAATKDIRLELLIKDVAAFASPQKDEWWIEVSYVDNSSGLPVFESSYITGALATSTAGWTATTYGGNNYDKYKIVITTTDSIKQYTSVTVLLKSTQPAAAGAASASGDFYFVDPDFQVE